VEDTLLLLKPDAVQRRLVGEILRRIEAKGLEIAGLKLIRISRETAERHYAPHQGKPFYPGLIQYITSGSAVALVVRGRNAIQVTRAMMGATFGSKAAPGTIRGDLAISDGFNLIHGSDSPEAAAQEKALYFRPEELQAAPLADQAWVYDCKGGTPV
jgi:nucleoside-diphosphate kinase